MSLLKILQSRGVTLLAPESVYIAPDVNPERIASSVTLYPGCRLSGAALSIGPNCVVGAEAPATVVDCQLGRQVHLAGGYFERATFLDGFKAGSGAHVRPACLFEEASSLAHIVGVKQTLLMPWVTAGSLINFCDCLMAGGTGRHNHSEIGSSYIHFNFTPHQDKATASLIGDVPHGVLLNQPAIFLGGQGGLVGPCRIAFGTVIPAGQVWRGDVTTPGNLVAKPMFHKAINTPYAPSQFHGLGRIIQNNLLYIGNLLALDAWYRIVRAPFMCGNPFSAACHTGARQRLDEMLNERIARFDDLAQRVARSLKQDLTRTQPSEHQCFVDAWPVCYETLQQALAQRASEPIPAAVQTLVTQLPSTDYLKTIQSLQAEDVRTLTSWLEGFPTRMGAKYGQMKQSSR